MGGALQLERVELLMLCLHTCIAQQVVCAPPKFGIAAWTGAASAAPPDRPESGSEKKCYGFSDLDVLRVQTICSHKTSMKFISFIQANGRIKSEINIQVLGPHTYSSNTSSPACMPTRP